MLVGKKVREENHETVHTIALMRHLFTSFSSTNKCRAQGASRKDREENLEENSNSKSNPGLLDLLRKSEGYVEASREKYLG